MELYKEILLHILADPVTKITISVPHLDLNQAVEGVCYQALNKIKAIIQDDSLDDVDCFSKIEEIISLLESLGISAGNRHDFG